MPPPCSVKVLADIELAQTLKSETEKAQEEMIETVPHPLDQDYNSLKCNLSLMETKTENFKVPLHVMRLRQYKVCAPFTVSSVFHCYLLLKVVEKYLKMTSDNYMDPKLVNVWEVNRETEVVITVVFLFFVIRKTEALQTKTFSFLHVAGRAI